MMNVTAYENISRVGQPLCRGGSARLASGSNPPAPGRRSFCAGPLGGVAARLQLAGKDSQFSRSGYCQLYGKEADCGKKSSSPSTSLAPRIDDLPESHPCGGKRRSCETEASFAAQHRGIGQQPGRNALSFGGDQGPIGGNARIVSAYLRSRHDGQVDEGGNPGGLSGMRGLSGLQGADRRMHRADLPAVSVSSVSVMFSCPSAPHVSPSVRRAPLMNHSPSGDSQ